MIMKKCSVCGKTKPIENFNKAKGGRYGVSSWCKECQSNHAKEYYKNNAEKIKRCSKEKWKTYSTINRDRIIKYRKEYYKANSDQAKNSVKKYRANNLEKERERQRKYCKINTEKRIRYSYAAYKKRKNNPFFKLNHNIRSEIRDGLKGKKNGLHWGNLVGYTLLELIKHIESKFKLGMNWSNYGKYGWHIDHIIPISLWKFETPQDHEFKQCWALCNLQPLWAFDNLSKGNKIDLYFTDQKEAIKFGRRILLIKIIERKGNE